jgi:hypothetical protein
VPPLAWLLVAVVAGLGAYLVGWPAWKGSRVRESRDLNAERYLAWRGRAPRRSDVTRERMTQAERRRVYAGAALAAVAVLALLAFFASS